MGCEVAFEVDGYGWHKASAWSVVVKGIAHEVGGAQEVNRLYDDQEVVGLPLLPWHSSPKPYFIRIEPDTISGRRFEVTDHARWAVAPGPLRHSADE